MDGSGISEQKRIEDDLHVELENCNKIGVRQLGHTDVFSLQGEFKGGNVERRWSRNYVDEVKTEDPNDDNDYGEYDEYNEPLIEYLVQGEVFLLKIDPVNPKIKISASKSTIMNMLTLKDTEASLAKIANYIRKWNGPANLQLLRTHIRRGERLVKG